MLAAVNVVVGVVVVAVIRSSINLFVNQVFPIDVSFLLSLSISTHCAEYLFFPSLEWHTKNSTRRQQYKPKILRVKCQTHKTTVEKRDDKNPFEI